MIPHKHADRIRLVSVTRPDNERWVGATLAAAGSLRAPSATWSSSAR